MKYWIVADVLLAVEQQTIRRQAIPPGPADLLVVALDVLGQVEVQHKAHVGLVDAHAEGDRGHHHRHVCAGELALIALACGVVQAGVIGQGRPAGFDQAGRQVVDRLAACCNK